MLGKTANGLLWMSRYLERSENTARLVEAGLRIALTRSSASEDEWSSIISTAAARDAFMGRYQSFDAPSVIEFLLRDHGNPSSVISSLESARTSARMVRTALTREVWEAVNTCWMTLSAALVEPVAPTELPGILSLIRQQCALVRGATSGTMLRNEIYNFIRIGTLLERADNTARILDVKYYVLLPAVSSVGSSLDNMQWETILRAASAERSFGWLHGGDGSPVDIANFLILDMRMPRSLLFCCSKLAENIAAIDATQKKTNPSTLLAAGMLERLQHETIHSIFETGLHEFIGAFIRDNGDLGAQIEKDYRFHD